MTLVEGDELQRIWGLVAELSAQLSANRELCTSLQQQLDELKVSAPGRVAARAARCLC